MKKVYFLFVLTCWFFNSSFAQSVLNPNDSVINYNSSAPPAQPAWGTIGKWVRTPRLSWNTSEYKCYIYKGCEFRLHFPKSYNPTANDGKKYPMLVFFHGLGEAGTIYDNEYQLYHGGNVFQAAVNNGKFDGYVLCMQSQAFWGGSQYQAISEIIDYMVANNKLDAFAVSCNGLSAGGQATWEMMFSHPSYVAADIPMSAASIYYTNSDTVNKVKFTPLWEIQGGLDGSPAPYTANQVKQAMIAGGANYSFTLFSTLGHDTWDSTWLLPDFFPFMLRAYGANPWPLYGRTQFCPGDNINVTLGLAPGYQAYQWRYNGNVLSATTNFIQATQPGKYDARVERNGVWSDWSRTPVNIVVQGSTPTPPIQVAGLMSTAIPSVDGKNYVNLQVSGSNSNYISYTWKKVGSDSVYSTSAVFKTTQPGYYIVAANQQYSCSSSFSSPFKVIDANGPNAPASAKSLTANALSNTQIQLSWSSPSQQANPPTAFEIYRKASGGSYAFVGQVNPSSTSYNDSLLSPKANYFYEVRAIDSTGAAAVSNEANATTFSDTTAPSIPLNLHTTYTTPSTISIAWNASTDNVSVDHYNIYVNGALSNVTTQTSFVLTGLTQSQAYAIYVKAVDGSNNVSPASNQITAEPILGGLKYSFYTTANAWSALPNFSTLTPVAQGVSANTDITVATQSTNYGFLWQGYIQVPVNGTYIFQTTSDDGSALWFNSINPTGAPTVNNDGAHSSQSKTSSSLTLTAGIYPICIEFFQATGGASMSVSWASYALYGNTTQHAIPNSYFVGTYVAAGSVPTKPGSVAATATAYNKINVTWKDNSSNETGFEVYRSTSSTGTYSIAGTTGAGATSFSDSGLTASTTYYYKVQAINKYGNSGLTAGDTTTTGGLTYKYYVGTWTSTPNFATLTPTRTGTVSTFTLTGASGNGYGFLFAGNINITTAGSYTFYTKSGNGSNLYIGGYTSSNLVVTNTFSSTAQERSGSITLAAGVYPIYVSYYYNRSNNSGGASLTVSYQGPGISKQTIPASVLIQTTISPIPSATTLALPATPVAPANFKAAATSMSQIALSWNASSGATGYKLMRSIGDNSHYTLLSNVGSSTVSYNDTGLNANLTHYYQIMAAGVGGTFSSASSASATTLDSKPVIRDIPATAVPYGVTTTIPVNATDADGDVLTYTGLNLPAFVSLNGSSLVTNPAQTDQGVYNNVTIIVSDPYGGKDTTIFTLTVNNNYPPTIDPIANYTMNENDVVSIPLSAHDQNNGDVLTWSVANMPNSYTLTDNGNGTATLKVQPNYLAAGTYNPTVTVSDGNGGKTTSSFTITVKNANPNTNIYVRFQYTDTIGKPWNSITGLTTNNLTDANNGATNVGLAVQGSWFTTYNTGSPTGNNSGVYPDAVLDDYLYFGIFGGPETIDTKITGLDTSRLYNLTFFASSLFPGTQDNGHTVYSVGSQSVSLEVQNNQQNTVSINSIKPASDGTITYHMAKGSDAQVGYINALVIQSIYDDGTAPVAATSLAAQNATGKGVQLTWTDVAYNENGYYVYRALTSNGVFNLISQTQAGAASFTDTTVSGNIQYSYKVAAFNSHGTSPYSNIATITTTNRIPKINAIADVTIKNNQTATVNITGIDDSTDHLTFSASGLPSFAKLVDNGNGTATISITPSSNTLGGYPVTVTVTDNSNATASTSFNILVADPNVSSTYLSFSDGAHAVPKPWNMLAGYPFRGTAFSNIVDDSNSPTGMTVTLKSGFQGVVQSGMQPVDGLGIYPNVVMRTAEYEGTTNKDTIVVSGLSATKAYNFIFFNSHDDGLVGNTNFNIGTTTVTLNATDNISKTVQINGVTTSTGSVNIIVSKATGASYAFISTMIIQSYATTYTAVAPTNLRTTTVTRNSIGLQWQDNSTNETGYQIWRAADSARTYTLLTTVAAGSTTYTDANLTSNKTYSYAVRAIVGTNLYTNYSNTASATTYSYSVYLNYTLNNNAPLPWNNLDALPVMGYSWSNFFDEKGMITSTGQVLNTDWAGLYSAGNSPLNNSGIYPDTVMIDSYGLFPGQTATLQITGLNIGMKYDFTFFASSNAYGDVNVAYTINGVTTLLNTSLNINGTETIYGVTPDAYGNVTISVAAGTPASQFGLIGALVVAGYTPSAAPSLPTLPGGAPVSAAIAQTIPSANNNQMRAFPNPFQNQFTLQVPAKNNSSVQVMMYDMNGKIVYSNNFSGLHEGTNELKIVTNNNLAAGSYTLLAVDKDSKATKTIKLVRE